MSGFVKLGDLTHIRTGKLDANASSENGQYPFFTCSKEPLRIASYSYDCECVLVAGNGDLNVKYYDGKFDAYQRTYIIESADKRKLLVKYLYFFLDIYVEVLRTQSIGGVIKYIKLSNLTDALIPLPSIKRQAEIIECLEKCNTLIDKRQREIALIEQTVKSRFIELFGDPVSNSMGLPTEPMTTICAIIDGDRGKNYPKQDEFSDTGYCLFLNAKNVTATGFSFENRMFITKEKDDALHNGKLERGDVVLTTRGTLGNLAFYDDSVPFENVRINSGMVILRMKKSVMTEVFFMEQFKLQLQSIKGKIASGSAQPQLPISTMNKIRILLAPMALQEQFAAFVEQTDKSKYYSSLSFRYCQAAANTYRQEWMTCRTSDF